MSRRNYANPIAADYIAVEADSLPGQRYALAEQYRQRQGLPAHSPLPPREPSYAPADQKSWLGRPKESAAVKAHNAQLQQMYLTKERTDYAQAIAAHIEYRGFGQAVVAAGAMENLMLRYDPNSLTFAFSGTLAMDTLDRLRTGTADINDTARSRLISNV